MVEKKEPTTPATPEVKSDAKPSKSATAHCSSVVQMNLPMKKVTVHPLVLLSVVDHFNRTTKASRVKRVIGVLLGSMKPDKELDIANSFAVPFDEDDKDPSVFFLDQDYLEQMYRMFHKVASRERIVGWYHTGPSLYRNDVAINALLKKFTPDPVLVIINAQPQALGLPTQAYVEVEEVHSDGSPPMKTFEHISSDIDAEEAEEVGVEHLLRDIKDQTAGTLSQQITNQLWGMRGMHKHLTDIAAYLRRVADGELPVNHQILYLLQDAQNVLPDIHESDFVRAHNMQVNDQNMCIYLGTLIRSVIGMHNLIDNKMSLAEAEKETNAEEKKEAGDKESKDGKAKDDKDKKADEETKKGAKK